MSDFFIVHHDLSLEDDITQMDCAAIQVSKNDK